MAWLKSEGFLHWRQNSGHVFAGERMIRLGMEGLPDIVVIMGPLGRMVGLEVKAEKGRLRPSQIEFAERLTNQGGVYRVVRSLLEAQTVMKEIVQSWAKP